MRNLQRSPLLRGLIAPALLILAVAAMYHGWFVPGTITEGDWFPTPRARMLDFWPIQSLWPSSGGMGGPDVFGMVSYLENIIYGGMAHLGIDYNIAERLVYIFPSVLLACLGGYVLSYSLYNSRPAAVITGLFLVSNSYIVIVDGGGQFTVGVAYAFIPWVLWAFRAALHSGKPYRYVLTALVIALQGTYDLRLTYVTIGMLALYVPFILAGTWGIVGGGRFVARLCLQTGIAAVVEALVNSPWLLPALLVHGQALTPTLLPGYNLIDQVHELSFMQMANALSLMHVFWPLNALGHIAPLDPVFFVVPLLVFLLLLWRSHNLDTLYLYVLSLVSVFLVKGSNPPGGEIYDWLFVHVPGFQWFRDPSKFYQPLMVTIAVLLGLVAMQGIWWLQHRLTSRATLAISTLWIGACLYIAIYPAFPGIVSGRSGTTRPKHVPTDYVRLNAMIENQNHYFRILWYPAFPRLGTFSELHPMIDATAMGTQTFASSQLPDSNPYSWLRLPGAENMLQTLSIKYVVVPSDPFHELYAQTDGIGLTQSMAVSQIRHDLPNYREITIGMIHVFENPHYLPLVYAADQVAQRVTTPAFIGPPISSATYISDAHGKDKLQAVITPVDGPSRTLIADTRILRAPSAIAVQRDSTTWIEVKVDKATQPFALLLLQGYNSNFRAYIVPRNKAANWWTFWSLRALPQRDHMIGNGYGNVWLVRARGSFSVVLVYWPQLIAAAGIILGWLTIIGCIGYIAFALWIMSLHPAPRESEIRRPTRRRRTKREPATVR